MQCNLLSLTWLQFDDAVRTLRARLSPDASGVYGPPRGGLPLAVALSHLTGLPLLRDPERKMIWIDDIVDSGKTIDAHRKLYPSAQYCSWVARHPLPYLESVLINYDGAWIVFPWEDPAKAMRDREDYLRRMMMEPA